MSHHTRDHVRLTAFEQRWAEQVLGWITSPEELFHWSARTDFPLADASVFADWHSDPHVAPHVLLIQDHAVAYGEVWSDRDEPAIELGRLIVAPGERRNRVGTRLIDELCRFAGDRREVWVRLLPANLPALRCYESAGFTRAEEEQQAAFNAAQRLQFVWMCRRNSIAPAVD